MEKKRLQLQSLKNYTKRVENEMTMILQNLQWDFNHLLKSKAMSICTYDKNHKIPPDKKEIHEKECALKCEGYTKEDILFPDPLDCNSSALVKLSPDQISDIINNAANDDPIFKKGPGLQGAVPLSLERLQCAYTADERRAIHNAVVNAVPSCHDLTDLALLSTSEEDRGTKTKSRMEILAELRDMKRRRTKYRVAAKTKNYSDVLRDVIKTQMELYTETCVDNIATHDSFNNDNTSNSRERCSSKRDSFDNTNRNTCNNDNFKNKHNKDSISSNERVYDKYNIDRNRRKSDNNDRHGKISRKSGRKHGDEERRYGDGGKYQYKGNIMKATEAGYSTERFNEHRKHDTDGKRYTDRSMKERDRSDERRNHRDEKRLKYDETYRNRQKRHDEIKTEFHDYGHSSEERRRHYRDEKRSKYDESYRYRQKRRDEVKKEMNDHERSSDERRKYHRDETRLRYDETYRDRLKSHDEIKKEIINEE